MDLEQTVFDALIVGGGPCGYTAALYCARAGLSALVLEGLGAGGQMATTAEIDNYPGFPQGVDGYDLAEKMQEGAHRFGAQTASVQVKELELAGDVKYANASGKRFAGRTMILACGASPRELGLARERELRGRGVSYCATCDGMMFRGKTVAVVGGGNTAAADAIYLARLCEKVYLIHRRGELRASRSYHAPLEAAGNIEFVWNSQVAELLAQEKLTGLRVENVHTGEARELPCAAVFVAVGTVPNSQLLQGKLALDTQGYVPSAETTRTEIPGVFAAGDLRAKPLRQVVTAISDGAVAAFAAEEYLVSKV